MRRGAAAKSTRLCFSAGRARRASVTPSFWLTRTTPMQNGADRATAAATTSHRATPSDNPRWSRAKTTIRSIEVAVATISAAMSAASSTSKRSSRRRPVIAVAAGRRARSSSSQLPYSAAKVCSGRGSFRSTHAAIGPDPRIIQGVKSVVRADTATATGYRNSPVACSERPSAAMMKENSPIWARLKPACTDVRGCQDHDGDPVAGDEGRVDEHTDRHEEDGPEHVPHGLDQALDLLLLP